MLEATQRDSYCWQAVARWEQAEGNGFQRLETAEGRDTISELDGRSLGPGLVERMYASKLDGEVGVKPEVPKRSPRRLRSPSGSGRKNGKGYFDEEIGGGYA